MRWLRACLLVLLSITLPVQAVMAAAVGGCLMHAQGASGAHGMHGDGSFGNPVSEAKTQPAGAVKAGDSPCPHHQASHHPGETATAQTAGPAGEYQAGGSGVGGATVDASVDSSTDCSNCSGCCPGNAPPSHTARWQAPAEQRGTLQHAATVPVSLALATLERPPRANARSLFQA